eukprot:680932-Amphidinium_carterae.1
MGFTLEVASNDVGTGWLSIHSSSEILDEFTIGFRPSGLWAGDAIDVMQVEGKHTYTNTHALQTPTARRHDLRSPTNPDRLAAEHSNTVTV